MGRFSLEEGDLNTGCWASKSFLEWLPRSCNKYTFWTWSLGIQNWEIYFKPLLRHAPPGLTHPYQPKIKLCLLTPCQRYCLIPANLWGYLPIAPSEIPLEPRKLFTPSAVVPSWCSKTNVVFLKNISDRHKVCCNLLAALLSVLTTTHHCFFSRLLLWISSNPPSTQSPLLDSGLSRVHTHCVGKHQSSHSENS